jgi:AcrR family transcriptional regulator
MAVRTRRRYSPRLPRAERREQLLDAALGLISAHGFGGLTMEGVAREVGIAKTVVYDLFPNREELLQVLLEREQERALADVAAAIPSLPLAGDPIELLTGSLTSVLSAVRRHPDTWRLILLPADGTPPSVRAEVDLHRERLTRQIEPMVAWGLDRLGLRLDPELTADTILGLCENAIRLTLTKPDRYPPDRVARFAADLVGAIAPAPSEPGRP